MQTGSRFDQLSFLFSLHFQFNIYRVHCNLTFFQIKFEPLNFRFNSGINIHLSSLRLNFKVFLRNLILLRVLRLAYHFVINLSLLVYSFSCMNITTKWCTVSFHVSSYCGLLDNFFFFFFNGGTVCIFFDCTKGLASEILLKLTGGWCLRVVNIDLSLTSASRTSTPSGTPRPRARKMVLQVVPRTKACSWP